MGQTIVIGAGVIGLACAYELLKRGSDVLVLDRGEPGSACSAGNAGWIVPAMSAPIPAPGLVGTSLRWMLRRDSPLYIQPRVDPAFAAWLWRFWRHCRTTPFMAGLDAVATLNQRTVELFDAWQKEKLDIELHRSGLLYVGLSEKSIAMAAHEVQLLEPYGYRPPERLSGDDIRDLEPGLSRDVAGGFLVPDELHVRPESLTSALVGAIRCRGGTVESGVEVVGLPRANHQVKAVQTALGDVPCDQVLITAGAWSGRLSSMLGCRLPIEAGKGYSITVDSPQRSITRPLDLIEAKVACSPFNGALRLAGTMELSGHNLRIEPSRVAAIRRAGDRYLGDWSRGSGEQVWVGMRPLTPDGLPIIGALPGIENAFIATGHAMLGVTLAPATGELIAEVMHAKATPGAGVPFSPDRFVRAGL